MGSKTERLGLAASAVLSPVAPLSVLALGLPTSSAGNGTRSVPVAFTLSAAGESDEAKLATGASETAEEGSQDDDAEFHVGLLQDEELHE
jgi:hypothetical protein